MPFPILGSNSAVAGYEIDNSLRFNDNDSPKLERTVGTPTNEKIYTISLWCKKGNTSVSNYILGTPPEGDRLSLGDNILFMTNGSADAYLQTARKTRDVSAFYHIVIAYDTTQSTAADRVKLYINGEQYTWDTSTTFPSLNNTNGKLNKSGETFQIGTGHGGDYLDGYLSEFHFIDGQALAPTNFGETNDNGVWIPKEYSGTYGNNGFFLEFQNSGSLGTDTSGNGNNFTATNLAATDQTTDTPTNNFITMNPLTTNSRGTFAEGNLHITTNVQGSDPYGQVEFGTFAVNKGKWYFEVKNISAGSGGKMGLGINEKWELNTYINGHNNIGSVGNAFYSNQGDIKIGSGSDESATAYGNNIIIGVAFDLDNSKIYFHREGTYQRSGDPANGTGGATLTSSYNDYWTPWITKDDTNYISEVQFNFGNPPFSISSGNSDANGNGNVEYAVPSGYYALCTKNLAEYG